MIEALSNDDGLVESELEPVDGGTWGGLLFDNPRIGLVPRLTWSFRFPFGEVARGYGSSRVFLDVEWLALPAPGWRNMSGQIVRKATDPAEASIYFFQHHQYDMIDLEIVEQQGLLVHCRVTLAGDLDGLGLDPVTADAWLCFEGITVHLSDTASADSALARLQGFTDIGGLTGGPGRTSGAFHFLPQD